MFCQNATLQAVGPPDLRDTVVKLCRDSGMNPWDAASGKREQEDCTEVVARFGEALGLRNDTVIKLSTSCTKPNCSSSEVQRERYLVYGAPSQDNVTGEMTDFTCDRCKTRNKSGTQTQELQSCGDQLIFAINRAMMTHVAYNSFKCPVRITRCGKKFNLASVVLWNGPSAADGHYVAYRREHITWYYFNDSLCDMHTLRHASSLVDDR